MLTSSPINILGIDAFTTGRHSTQERLARMSSTADPGSAFIGQPSLAHGPNARLAKCGWGQMRATLRPVWVLYLLP